jgi:hypothetical protein
MAHKWFNLAGANGNENGIRNRDKLPGQQAVLATGAPDPIGADAPGDDDGGGSMNSNARTDASRSWFSRWFGDRLRRRPRHPLRRPLNQHR